MRKSSDAKLECLPELKIPGGISAKLTQESHFLEIFIVLFVGGSQARVTELELGNCFDTEDAEATENTFVQKNSPIRESTKSFCCFRVTPCDLRALRVTAVAVAVTKLESSPERFSAPY